MLVSRQCNNRKEGACRAQEPVYRTQISYALKQAQTPTPVAEVIRKMGITEQTFYRWKKQYGGMGVGELRRLRLLKEENRKLKQLVAALSLDKHILRQRTELRNKLSPPIMADSDGPSKTNEFPSLKDRIALYRHLPAGRC